MKKIIVAMALITMIGCVKTVFLPDKEQPLSVVPGEWKNVVLKSVRGPDQTYIQSEGMVFQLGHSPTSVLKRVLQKRLGKKGEILLYVDNVRYAITRNSIGVGADFILKRENETKKLSLEHTADIPVRMTGGYEFNRKEILENALSRAVVDLTDIFLFNPEALQFIGGKPTELKDSALLSDVDVGPVVALKPSSEERYATGRILWGTAETQINFMGTILLGDIMKGGFFYLYNRDGMKGVIPRYGFGLGGMSGGGFSAFVFNFTGGVELGYHGTMKTRSGYVNYPGFTAIVVPQFLWTGIIGGAAEMSMVMNMFMFGGSFEVDIPIMKYTGLTGGIFAGTGGAVFSVNGYSDAFDLGFIWYPMGDLYIQTSVGRFSVGMTFQQLVSSAENIGSVFDNPMITIKYEMRAGRGLAYTKSEIAAGKIKWTKEEVLSNPKNVFRNPRAIKIETPPVLDEE